MFRVFIEVSLEMVKCTVLTCWIMCSVMFLWEASDSEGTKSSSF